MSTEYDSFEQSMFARGVNPNARGGTGCRVCDCTIYRHQEAHGNFLDGCKCGHIDLAHNGDAGWGAEELTTPVEASERSVGGRND